MPNPSNIDAPVSLIGAPRSGTTLLTNIFRSHPAFDSQVIGETANLMFGTWHAMDFAKGVTRPTLDGERIMAEHERAGRVVRATFLSLFPDDAQRWFHKPIGLPKAISERFDETQWDAAADWYWEAWDSCFPKSTALAVLRNPWDVVRSQKAKMGFEDESLWWSYAFLTHIMARRPERFAHVIRYETLVANPEVETRRLFDALDIEFDDRVLEEFNTQHVPNTGTTPPPEADAGRARSDYRQRISDAFEVLGQPLTWPAAFQVDRTSVAPTPTNDPAAHVVELKAEVARLDRTIESLTMSHAEERRHLRQELARWRNFVNRNRARLAMSVDLEAELDRQLSSGHEEGSVLDQDDEQHQPDGAYVQQLEAELAHVYGSRTWRTATKLWEVRSTYRHDGLQAAVRGSLSSSTKAKVKDVLELRHSSGRVAPIGIAADRPPAIALSLPSGVTLGGVTSWAIEMSRELAAADRAVLFQHPEVGRPLDVSLPTSAEVVQATSKALPRPTMVRRLAPEYATALPAVVVPNYNYGGYALLAELSGQHGEHLRVVAMAHTDQLHYYSLLSFYEPLIHQFVAVSDEIGDQLRSLLPGRADDIAVLPYGVSIPNAADLFGNEPSSETEPLQIVYAGRLEAEQKRVLRLIELAAKLGAAGVNFQLNIVGNGEEESKLRDAHSELPPETAARVTLSPSVAPTEMSDLWQRHDVCVLVSAYEGTSIAMLEAMANGCVPVVTSVSGTDAVITSGINGISCAKNDLDEMVAAFQRLDEDRSLLADMAKAAHERTAAEYDFSDHAAKFRSLCLSTWEQKPRVWPEGRQVVPVDRDAFEATVQSKLGR